MQLESDSAATRSVYYTISGPGYNQNPVNIFALDSDTGKLSVLKSIDREEFPSFTVGLSLFCFEQHEKMGTFDSHFHGRGGGRGVLQGLDPAR